MNILVLGATGFIGSHVTHILLQSGYQVFCGVRNPALAKKLFPKCKTIVCDFQRDTHMKHWLSRLENIDVIINCIGIFYHPNKRVIWNIHYHTPRAIFDAAFEMNVKQIIQVSALNSEIYPVEYAKSKKEAETYLLHSGVPAVILKPSLVYGTGASGGMKLFRALASFPLFLFVPGKGEQKFQPIHIDDLTRSILHLIKNPTSINKILSAVSLKTVTLLAILKTWRKWLGFSRPIIIYIPLIFLKISNLILDRIPYSTVNSESLKMLSQNNIVNKEAALAFQHEIGFQPRNFIEGLLSTPCDTPNRWYSIFAFFRPILRLSLAFVWMISAITSAFLYPKISSYQLLSDVGITSAWQPFLLYTACVINFLIGIALIFDFKSKLNYLLQIIIIIAYSLIITIKLPALWLEPFGPIAKNIPLLVFIWFLYVMERDE